MASKGKKIQLLDASGMLSKEALLGYVYNELTPPLREEVERHLAENEMYRDMVEGLQQVPDRVHAEKVIHTLNVDIAERSGSTASVPGLSENVGDFFWTYRRVAAAVGSVLLVSAAVFVFALMQVSNNEKQVVSADEKKGEFKESPPPAVIAPEKPLAEKADSVQPIAGLEEDLEESNLEVSDGSGTAAGSYTYGFTTSPAPVQDENTKKQDKAKQTESRKDVKGDAQVGTTLPSLSLDSTANPNLAMSELAKESEKREKSIGDNDVYYQPSLSNSSDMLNSSGAVGNTTSKGADDYYKFIPRTTAEKMPEFPGGEDAFARYLRENLKYPKDSKEKGTEGKVYLSFTIGTAGKVKDITVITGVNKEINAEAIRLLASMPKWSPGVDKGETVPVMLYCTIDFKIPVVQEKK